MLLCVKSRLLSGDFVANIKLLQHYPDDINLEYLLQVAQDISPDTSSYFLSLWVITEGIFQMILLKFSWNFEKECFIPSIALSASVLDI